MSVNVPLRTVYAYDLLSSVAIGRRVDAVVDAALRGQMVGAQVRIALDGQLIYQRNAGVLDANGTPVTAACRFRLACLSRLPVAIATLALVQQEHLYLDEDIRQWLPEFSPTLANGSPAIVTVRQLLSHCAGVTNDLPLSDATHYEDACVADDCQRPAKLQQLGQVPLQTRPGSTWSESLAYDVLGALLARHTGNSLKCALQQRVFGPLQLPNIGFDTPAQGRPGPIFIAGQPFMPSRDGMTASADAYLQLLETLRLGGGNLLSKVMVSEMTTVQTGDQALPGLPGRGHGLGFSLLRDPSAANSPESPGSWRMDSACGHSWFVDPTQRLSVVALSNTPLSSQNQGFANALRNAVYGV